jgi:hypothetical protein
MYLHICIRHAGTIRISHAPHMQLLQAAAHDSRIASLVHNPSFAAVVFAPTDKVCSQQTCSRQAPCQALASSGDQVLQVGSSSRDGFSVTKLLTFWGSDRLSVEAE